jgi:hypothetical protein
MGLCDELPVVFFVPSVFDAGVVVITHRVASVMGSYWRFLMERLRNPCGILVMSNDVSHAGKGAAGEISFHKADRGPIAVTLGSP